MIFTIVAATGNAGAFMFEISRSVQGEDAIDVTDSEVVVACLLSKLFKYSHAKVRLFGSIIRWESGIHNTM